MNTDRTVLSEIIKARSDIKRKFNELKIGEAEIYSKISRKLRPIIDPLNKIQQQIPEKLGETSELYTVSSIKPPCIDFDNWFQSSDKDNT